MTIQLVRLQFSLRFLMLATVAAALAAWWLSQPRAIEQQLPGGVRVRNPWPEMDSANLRLPDTNSTTASRRRFSVRDEHGRLWCRGNPRSGNWTFFQPSTARRLQSGLGYGLVKDGVWTAWHPNGRKWAEVRYATNSASLNSGTAELVSRREGPARLWWEDGVRRASGDYRDNVRQGLWRFWTPTGRSLAEGRYFAGQRHGAWRFHDERTGIWRDVFFAEGRRVDAQRWFAETTPQLESADPAEQQAAARLVAGLGPSAVPHLKQLLAGDNETLRQRALEIAARLGPDARELLAWLAPLAKSDNARLRFAALAAQVGIDEQHRRERLEKFLAAACSAKVADRRWAAEQLGWLDNPETLSRLEQLLRDPRPVVREFAVVVCGVMLRNNADPGNESSLILHRLLEAATRDDDATVADAAERLLALFPPSRATGAGVGTPGAGHSAGRTSVVPPGGILYYRSHER